MLGKLKRITDDFNSFVNDHAEKAANPYRTFGIFGVITYQVYYFIWAFADAKGFDSLPLRAVAVILCFFLIFHDKWPKKCRQYLGLYWYFTQMYCFPLLFTYLLLKNGMSHQWVLNTMAALVLAVLLLDFWALLIIMPLGIAIGWLGFYLDGGHTGLPTEVRAVVVSYLSTILFGAIFAHRKEAILSEKIQTIKALGAGIAHELRTPLRSVTAAINGIGKQLPTLIQSYRIAKKADLEVPYVNPIQCDSLQMVCQDIESEVNSAFTVIEMLLTNISHLTLDNVTLQACSIKACVDEALNRYPFYREESTLVSTVHLEDFMLKGEKNLIIHVMFNLIRNSLYYMKASGKEDARIYISTRLDKKYNVLIFKDTGTGILKQILPHIFKQFYSRTYHGSGIGLSFCKQVMKSFGGDILCDSVEGEHSTFELYFPTFYT